MTWEELYPLGRENSWYERFGFHAFLLWGLKHHPLLKSEWYEKEPFWVTMHRPGYEKIGEILRSGG